MTTEASETQNDFDRCALSVRYFPQNMAQFGKAESPECVHDRAVLRGEILNVCPAISELRQQTIGSVPSRRRSNSCLDTNPETSNTDGDLLRADRCTQISCFYECNHKMNEPVAPVRLRFESSQSPYVGPTGANRRIARLVGLSRHSSRFPLTGGICAQTCELLRGHSDTSPCRPRYLFKKRSMIMLDQ
jgi:hypothetical protein